MYQRSLRAVIIVVCIIVSAVFTFCIGSKSQIFYGDAMGYYLYLPSTFIHHNLSSIESTPMDHVPDFVKGNFQNYKNVGIDNPGDHFVIQYTYGNAIMEFPFFLIAHLYEKAAGLPAAGYSNNYQLLIKFGSFLYGLLGLLLLYRILRRYFDPLPSLLSIVFIFMGTNLFWFSLYQGGMSHVPLFFLFTALIYLSIRLHERPSTSLFLLAGLVAGLIVLIRPSDIVALAIPLLYGVYNKETFMKKVTFIRINFLKIVAAGVVMGLLWIPQFLYWKSLTGHYFYDSYKNQSFNWTDPQIMAGIFYASNGWLFYSPIMAFALIGFLCYRKIKTWAFALYLLFPIYIYVVYSWYCYNYINGLGSRPMIHIYPLLAIPLAALIHYISSKRMWLKVAFGTLSLFFIAINISYSVQQAKGILFSESSNVAFNMQMLFRYHLTYDDLIVKDVAQWQPDTTKLERTEVLAYISFEDSLSDHYRTDITGSKYIYEVREGEEYHEDIPTLKYDAEKFKDVKWIKCSGRFYCTSNPGYYEAPILVVQIRRGEKVMLWKGVSVSNKLGDMEVLDPLIARGVIGIWGKVSYFVKVPDGLKEGDDIGLMVWNIGKHPYYMDDLSLELYKEK